LLSNQPGGFRDLFVRISLGRFQGECFFEGSDAIGVFPGSKGCIAFADGSGIVFFG
jgi:hypothetical protein